MKLWYSTTSPFVRKVRSVIAYHQLEQQVELLPTVAAKAESPHNQDNPLGRIPALQTDQGEWLFNSSLIAEYLDSLGKKPPLFPQGENRWQLLNLHAITDGIMENTLMYLGERMLRDPAEWWHSRHQQMMERNIRSLRYLEQRLAQLGTELNIATLYVVCVIDFFHFRLNVIGINPAEVVPHLDRWARQMNQKYPCLTSTKPYQS
ncbi:glutathione S-transferase [Testudinibacter sp. TR-2022]|uniref:glutathione S-transferase N-terminal domain-containing protein n=1 Tax=Testudinibacter sp. TR-2022 TaxID=2585029 RepID=UPI001119F662|nr:glutathione S-transferase [Testudinibacter sp. TR-2022]TNH05161.1 glutathione S-transferase [Pasteurellaceae bacterium Phil31]TNH05872.1 glutathione S-transferase [Testudinibacter sp. TR-2022]TNH11147.1 glutathione S-transferase [Testudinibacter sp. TR-2022]TNH12827.1 glutathione S-transferase [Testudinibacter sp. TR-2022]TNH14071.1 glutathione S-transferase [Testudinibacter sp. TR-2022]